MIFLACLVIQLLCMPAWSFPHQEAVLTQQWPTPSISNSATQRVSDAAPGSYVTPWQDQIPSSIERLLPRNADPASETAPATTPPTTSSPPPPAQFVLSSTKLSSLPAGICGFVPYWNGSVTTLGMLVCTSAPYPPQIESYFASDDLDASCIINESGFYCATGESSLQSGYQYDRCIDLTSSSQIYTSTSVLTWSYYSSRYYYSYDTTYMKPYWTYSSGSVLYETVYAILSTSYYTTINYTTYSVVFTFDSSTQVVTAQSVGPTPTVQTILSIMTHSSLDLFDTSADADPSVLTCDNGYYAETCQVMQMSESLQAHVCRGSSTNSMMTYPTLSVLKFDDVRTAFTGMTLELSANSYSLWLADMYVTQTLPLPASKTPSPSNYMDKIRHSPPSCVDTTNNTCPSLFESSRKCWSEAFPPGPQGCYCSALQASNCTSFCQSTPQERRSYFEWAMKLCSHNYTAADNTSITANFTTRWPEYQNRSLGIYQDLFLRAWRLEPEVSTSVTSANNAKRAVPNLTTADASICPSSNKSKLISFMIVNIITAFGALLARRDIANSITNARFGNPGSRGWLLTALLSVSLNLLATAINARVALKTSGYTGSLMPSLTTLFLFWTARPRLGWIVAMFMRVRTPEMIYISAGASALLAEVLQQSIGAYTLIWTLKMAAERGYLSIRGLDQVPGSFWALFMYIGALVWLLGFAIMLLVVWNWIWILPERRKKNAVATRPNHVHSSAYEDGEKKTISTKYDFNAPSSSFGAVALDIELHPLMSFLEAAHRMGLSEHILSRMSNWCWVFLLPFIGQWIFWAGYINFFSAHYCPPKIAAMTAAWTFFELIGIWIGAIF